MKIAFNRGNKSISGNANRQMSAGCLIPFGLIFVVVGCALTYFLAVVPLYKWQAAQSWESVPCTITVSEVDSQSDSDGTTYKAIVRFKYSYQGRDYSGGSYDFNTGYSSGSSGKQAIVSRFPAGSASTCYVNPKDPGQAILSRDFSWGYLIGLFGLIFLGAGLAVMYGGFHSAKKNKASISARGKKSSFSAPTYTRGSTVLKAKSSPLQKFIGITIFAIIWNGIVGVIFVAIVSDFSSSGWFPLIFISIFLLIGLLLIFFVFYQFLALYNPRPRLTLSEGAIPLGDSVEMTWTFEGSVNRMDALKIWVQGRLEATYRQGTDTRTDKSTFEKIPILETRHTQDMITGKVQFVLPEFTMHSFKAPNNKVIWSIHVHGDIPKWPDVQEEFPITVIPLQPQGS